MGKVNGCLNCIFIFFNVLFAILGVLLVGWLVKATFHNNQLTTVGSPSAVWIWVLALAVLGMSCLGIFAGCSENPLVLKIFAGFMGVGMIIMLIFGVILTVEGNKLTDFLNTDTAKDAQAFTKDPESREQLDKLQGELSCCGFQSASDWGDEIPASCACLSTGPECQAKPEGSKGPDQVYKEPCSDIFSLLIFLLHIFMGIVFGLAVLALFGLLISLLMIHQIERHNNPGISFTMKGY